ncbi:MAG: ABC transporter permease [Ilumatobacter sp.]|uniref:ABC transporter permease n=1 Tax=Ilumatobacter sp. TaxID=1967498 RepID=UPI00391B5F55
MQVPPAPPTTTTQADEVEDVSSPVESRELPPAIRLVKSNAGLLITPLIVIAGSIALYLYNASADKIFQDERALNWDRNLRPQLEQHLSLTFWSTIFTVSLAVPLGILLTRPKYKRAGSPILAIATSGQAIPAFGLLVLAFAWLGRGPWTTIWALALFTLLPVLRNTMVGLEQVDKSVIEAGRGMGLTKRQTLRQIELPLAIPVILAGVRTALVITVGMAALAFLIGGGGLGATISAGLKLSRDLVLITGAVMTALVALSVDWIAALIEKTLRPSGL